VFWPRLFLNLFSKTFFVLHLDFEKAVTCLHSVLSRKLRSGLLLLWRLLVLILLNALMFCMLRAVC